MSLPRPSPPSQAPSGSNPLSQRRVHLPSPLPLSDSATPSPPVDQEHPKPPPFAPFFTLLVDSQTGEYHHPTTHYVFSDDGSDLITAAALRTLDDRRGGGKPEEAGASLSTSGTTTTSGDEQNGSEAGVSGSVLPPRRPGIEERYIVLDIAEAGDAVLGAHSLSEDWQVLDTDVRNAPTWDKEEEGGAGLMLRIEGMGSGEGNSGVKSEAELGELVGEWEKRIAELRKVIGEVESQDEGAGEEAVTT